MDAEVQDRLRGRTSLREEDESVGGGRVCRRTSFQEEDESEEGGRVFFRRTSLLEENEPAGIQVCRRRVCRRMRSSLKCRRQTARLLPPGSHAEIFN